MKQNNGFIKTLFILTTSVTINFWFFSLTRIPSALFQTNDDFFVIEDDETKTSSTLKTQEYALVDSEAIDCTDLLAKFRADKIQIATNMEGRDFRRSYVAINLDTDKPFYVSTHDPKIDSVRKQIMHDRRYYEFELTQRVVEIFERKSAQGEECIMLDVGANIGWFSLVAAAHGAWKVYSFEPNLQNSIRFCESLSLNRWLHDDRSQDRVIPIAKGVGITEEMKTLYATSNILDNPGSFTFQKEKAYFTNSIDENNNTVKVPLVIGDMQMTSLDLFAGRHGWFDSRPCIALFKLDVEHFEFEVLQGAEKLLQSHLIETIAMELKASYPKPRKSNIIKLLYSSGYEIYKHGRWMGPKYDVEQVYENWKDLVEDIHSQKYGENVMFRLKSEKQK